jgi:glycolate oxidase FAD binding subunit
MAKTCLIDMLGPLPIFQPTKVAEIGDVVRNAIAGEEAVYPIGGATTLAYGWPPMKPGVAVDTRQLDAIIDYPARDMTITVQAGVTLDRLQSILAEEDQRLPVDVPQADLATLGGALATNASGPRRYGFGTLRDHVIGISVVNDRGEEIKAGGRVVKNVAGYDLCKLYIGSLGTLGIITQVTLKLHPRPEQHALVAIVAGADTIESLLARVHGARIRPVCIELLNPSAVQCINRSLREPLPEAAWIAVVGFEDNKAAVDWQTQELVRELAQAGYKHAGTRVGAEADELWRALVEHPGRQETKLQFKASLLPHACAAFCRQAGAMPELLLQAHAGNGIVVGQADEPLSLDTAAALLDALRATACEAQGNLVIQRCPTAWKSVLPIWGTPGDFLLMRAIKDKLDPGSVFNPGRFVDGI